MSYKNDNDNCKLFVGNLPRNLNYEELRELFSQVGDVKFAKVLNRENIKIPYGFVIMSSENDAKRARDTLDGYELDGRIINVEISTNKNKQGQNQRRVRKYQQDKQLSDRVMFVCNLPFTLTEDDLIDLFADFKCENAKLVFKDGQSKGFGFIRFPTEELLQEAITMMNNHKIGERYIKVRKAFKDDDLKVEKKLVQQNQTQGGQENQENQEQNSVFQKQNEENQN
ncbi:nucleic acid binding protein [Anaeramoeba flamelloides]|uniref:Nucleic acid binding protein n=1 Tax=Anaeramoeba flamelloides TaxID=1746091 RepID=A0AAV7ZGC7_9EUKA|nr:nucleic acid binding protein [Anaeramoeba flamelloides]KAJ6244040.1 nucleic acid binding protein [Anaeramoeba flamelloides]